MKKMNALILFTLWSIWIALEFLLGPFSHVRIHDTGDQLLPQLIGAKIQFENYYLSYFAPYIASGIDATSQDLLPFLNINSLLFMLFPGWMAWGILMFAQRFLASYFTFRFAKDILKLDLLPSTIAALIFSLFDFSIFSFTLYHQLGLPALPLVLYILEKNTQSLNHRNIFFLVISGLAFGYISGFIYGSVYLLPFILIWFLFIRSKINRRVFLGLFIFSLFTLLVQFPYLWALLTNLKLSQRLIFDPTVALGDYSFPEAIFLDLKSRIVANIVSISIILICLKSKVKKSKLAKNLLFWALVIIILPTVLKFFRIFVPEDFRLIRSFSYDRLDMLVPFVLSVSACLILHQTFPSKKLTNIPIYIALVIILIGASLKVKVETLLNYAPYKNLYMHPQLIELANSIDNRKFRVATITGGGIRPAYAQAYGLYTADASLTLYPKAYHDFWYQIIEERIRDDKMRYDDYVKWGNRILLHGPNEFNEVQTIDFEKYYDLDLLSQIGVKYIIAQKPVIDENLSLLPSSYREEQKDWDKLTKLQKLKEFIQGKYFGPSLYIYENKKVLPRFFALENGEVSSQPIQVVYYSPDKIILTANNTKPSQIVATINYYPWWKATVNGQRAAVSKYQGAFISVEISQDNNTVILEYDPPYKI